MFRNPLHSQWYPRHFSLFVLGLVLGGAAFLATYKHGLGVSTDAVDYMFTGLSLANGKGFITYSGRTYSLWPPLYPAVLALIHAVTRLNMLSAASILHWTTHILLAAAVARLYTRFFPDRWLWPVLGVLLTFLAPVYLAIEQNVSSDLLFLLFSVLFFLDAFRYIETGCRSAQVCLFLWGMLAALQRYIGVSLILTAALVVFFASRESLGRRLLLSILQLLAAAPLLVWVGRNIALDLGAFGVRGTTAVPPVELFAEIWRLFSGWFIFSTPYAALNTLAWTGFGLVFALVPIFTVAGYRIGKLRFQHPLTSVIIFFGIYCALVLLSLSNVQVTSIQDRFLAPIYIPIVLLLLQTLDTIEHWLCLRGLPAMRQPIVSFTLALIPLAWLLGFLPSSALLLTSFDEVSLGYGNMYNNSQWANKGVIRFWKENPPGTQDVLYSNIPAGVAFHTWHTVLLSPRAYTVVKLKEHYDLEKFDMDFNNPGKTLYLVWVEPNYYDHVFHPVQLRQILQMKKVAAYDDGSAVFRIALLNAE